MNLYRSDTAAMKLSDITLWVADATLSYKFYKKLGFEIVEVNDRHAVVACEGIKIILITMRDEDEFNKDSLASIRGLGMYIRFNIKNVDEKYQKIVSLGIQTSSEPRDWPWGTREFVVKDLDGYKLCFVQELEG